jgi:hypothetical protein
MCLDLIIRVFHLFPGAEGLQTRPASGLGERGGLGGMLVHRKTT